VVRGPAGTTVNITFLREEEEVEFTIERAHIEIPNTEAQLLEGGIGYVRLFQFTDTAREELDAAIESLNPEELNGLILDLRGNGGGYLNSAVEVASAFLVEGQLVLTEDFGERGQQVYEASSDNLNLGIPIVILVDETSASASELVSGAWQDHGVAVIIGEVTLGKGTVQTWRELVNGGGIRLTVARWLTPNGNWIHGVGITPDIIVEWTPENFDDVGNPETDPQLAAALDYFASLESESADSTTLNETEPAVTPADD
jgi:carboxyl-terminal processing protease